MAEQSTKCPFCGEDDFDLPGLANHIAGDRCDKFTEAHNKFWEDEFPSDKPKERP